MDAVALGGRDVLAVDAARAGVNYASLISHMCERLQVKHLLSYGYGTKWLFNYLKVGHPMRLQAYEPKKDTPAVPAQFVVCLDVLGYEDYEPVIDELERLTEGVLFANIRTNEEQTIQWWIPKFWDRFDLHTVQVAAKDEFFITCYAKPKIVSET